MDKFPKRKDLRLEGYDYSQAGYYFVTVCTKDKKNIFWNDEILVGETFGLPFKESPLSIVGKSVDEAIQKIDFLCKCKN